MVKTLTKEQILKNLRWHNVKKELPNDFDIVELRNKKYWEPIDCNNEFSYPIMGIYYHICRFSVDENNNNIFASIGNPLVTYNRSVEIGFDIDINFDKSKYDSHGNEIIVVNPEKDETGNNIYEWRYIVESNGDIFGQIKDGEATNDGIN